MMLEVLAGTYKFSFITTKEYLDDAVLKGPTIHGGHLTICLSEITYSIE